jgi:nucleoside-diphosphate-sugar epimerase
MKPAHNTVLIAGATGVVGFATMKHFASQTDYDVFCVARRAPTQTFGARFVSLDLTDEHACVSLEDAFPNVTHLVYAALFEKQQLLAGWRDPDQISINSGMLRNILDLVIRKSKKLEHVTVLQGTKAYGIHVRPIPTPAREDRDEAYDVPNFYWEQEKYLKAKYASQSWSWTIFRPQAIFGQSIGSAMNAIAALGVYAAVLKDRGEQLSFPGGDPNIMEAIDSDILAHAIEWAGRSPAARNQVFNITNGDVFLWQSVWPAIADALGMQAGEPRRRCLAVEMLRQADAWDSIRRRYNLVSPALEAFVGRSFQFVDSLLGTGDPTRSAPGIVSTVKLRKAGFTETIDTEVMLRKWFRVFQEQRLLPPIS